MMKAVLILLALVASAALANPVKNPSAASDYDDILNDVEELRATVSNFGNDLFKIAKADNKPLVAASFNAKINAARLLMFAQLDYIKVRTEAELINLDDVRLLYAGFAAAFDAAYYSAYVELQLFTEPTLQSMLNSGFAALIDALISADDLLQTVGKLEEEETHQASKEILQEHLSSLKQRVMQIKVKV